MRVFPQPGPLLCCDTGLRMQRVADVAGRGSAVVPRTFMTTITHTAAAAVNSFKV